MNGHYEIGAVLTPDCSEEDVKKTIEIVTSMIEKENGKIEKIDDWGKKNLAYPIRKHLQGHYFFVLTTVDGKVLAQVERRLRQLEKVMRFIIVRLDDKLDKANKLVKKWAKIDKIHARKNQEERSRQEDDEPAEDTEENDNAE